MRKTFLSLLLIASLPLQAGEWLDPMIPNKSQISINFVNLLGDEQASLINVGSNNNAEQKHYLAGVLIQKDKPKYLALIVANLDKSLSGFDFDFNHVNVKATCSRLKGDVADELLKTKAYLSQSVELYYKQMSFSSPWHQFKQASNTKRFIQKISDVGNVNSISLCEIPSQFL
ncbi:hypothetical protein I6E85_11270 [Pseudoalteromonas sp. NZS71]|uniref:hypothetical protein n=1 Tax=unclassified Pseudoalteromonas TaxID=194690 RepID=UPI000403E3F4|nr:MULTISPECIES: hypothetical protein [unclassified Pseudoalteromonas]MBH0061736.1 hypothetical protein [Pseudoalteromonas sp. NZS71]|tara:strand:- start:7146 stop:7664 length:519 start_codon:yes stop_codon:yes gene_type:complete